MAKQVARENAGGLSRQALFTQGLPRNIVATSNPGANDDINSGYNVGSIWVNVSTDAIYFCADAADGAAVWALTASDAVTEITELSDADGNFIVGNGSAWVAESGATARTSLGLGTAAVAATGISNTNVPVFTSGVADNDFLRVDGTSVEGLSAAEVAAAIEGSIDAVGTIATGVWEGTDIAVAHGGTGASSLTTNALLTGNGTSAIQAESTLTFTGDILTATSTSADLPMIELTNTHAGATAGKIRFSKDSASGDDNDVMGTIEFFGTDAGEATHERLAYIDSYIIDAAAGSEAAGLRFYVAENDATLTQGLAISGQPDDDGEVDVTIGAGAASTTTIAGTLTMGSTATLTNAGLVAVANQSNITGVSTLSSGAVSSGFGNIDIGSSNLTATGTVSLGSTSFNDNNITNVGSVALDTITSDGTDIGFGTDGSGEDVYFYSATSGDHMFWDASEEKLVITGTDSQNSLEVADGNVTITDNLTVSGDFTVSGTTTTIDTTNLTVTDPLIKLAHGTTASPANDLGIIFTRGNGSSTDIANRAILWDESADEFAFANTNDEAGTTTGNVDLDDYANIRAGTVAADDAVTVGGNAVYSVGGTDVAVTDGGTGASSLTSNAVLTGNGTSAIQAEADLLFSSNKLIPTASAHDAAGTALTISAGATTAGTSNNQAGGALTFQGGQGKGSGAGGAILFQVANEGGSGSSLNSLATALTINDDSTITTAGAIELGHASDTTLARSGSGDLTIEGNAIYRAGGTDVPVADGGTGASSLTDNAILTGTGTSAITAESTLAFTGDILTASSTSADLPRIDITNTHAGATAGKIRFSKDSGSGDDNDVMGTIEFFGTDAGEATHERLAYIDSYIIDSAAGSEAAGLRFYVAENDATNTLGLQILGQADDDGEVDVVLGAGTASTTTIAGTLTMGSTAALTNAGLVAVANQSNITGLGTISSGTWEATDVAVAHGGTGASTLTANGVLIGNGTSAVTAVDMSTKGGLLAGDGSGNPSVLAVGGTGGHVLTVDSSEATGMKWAAVAAGSATSLDATSSSANEPVITIENTHADATAGFLKFIKNPGSGQGADNDIMGTITFYGTDAGNNAIEELARMEAYIIEADHGSEAGGIKFYVAENDATMTAGLQILGVKDADGEIDVTIGAGAASTTTIAGTLTMGSTAAMTNAGLVSVANQSNITGLGTISSGVWEGTDVGVAHGGTGASSLTDGGVLLGSGTGAITAMAVLSDGEMIVGDGSTDPVAESGATLRTSIGVGTGDTPQFTGATLSSSSANEPLLTITNTHADATSGIIKFIKDPGSGQGADSDTIGTLTFHGTDAGNNAPEELARMEAYVIEADHGSEAGGIKFSVAENDATMTAGLQILGVKDADGEIDVTIGAGAASTTTIAGTLTMGSTAAMTNAGLLSVGNQTGITGTGALNAGSITSGFTSIDVGSGGITTTGAIAGGTIDASTDFTIGDTIITNGVITDSSGLSVAAATTVTSTLTVGEDDTGHDVKFFGASAGAYMEWDQSEDQLRIMGASADAATSTGKLLLATSLTDINANDVLGKIDFQAPHEAGGTDAITVAASIQAIAQGTFSGSVNATDLIFYTGHSEAATEKFRMTSQGELGIGGANYGTDGQVLTSGGAGAAAAWEDAGGGQSPYDAIVASSGGDYSDLQTAEDALDGGSAYKALVKQATYSETTWTIDTAGSHWVIEGGTTITGSIVLSANDASIEFGPGCTVSATVTISGTGCHVFAANGFSAVQLVVSGHNNTFDGGGWDSLINGGTTGAAVAVTGNHNQIKNFRCGTTQGQGNTYDALYVNGYWNDIDSIYVTASDQDGISMRNTSAAATCKVTNCRVTNIDRDGIVSIAVGNLWMNNLTWEVDGIAYFLLSNCDDSVMVGNRAYNTTGATVNISSDSENCVVVGNRLDGAITDSDGTGIVASNDVS